MSETAKLYKRLQPYIAADLNRAGLGGGGGSGGSDPGAITVHDIEVYHSGTLRWERTTVDSTFLRKVATGPLNMQSNNITNVGTLHASKVGVGTDNPDGLQANAAVSETARGIDNVRLGVLAGTPRIIFEDATSTQYEIDNSSGNLRFFQPGVVRMTLDGSGRLGIGKTPDALLDVNGGSKLAADTDTASHIGRAAVGYGGSYSDFAYFGHLDFAGAGGNYAVLQSWLGDSFLNAATGRTLHLRINNADKITVDDTQAIIHPSVALTSSTYASQTTGWRVTHDGQADFRYLFVDEMHAKVFIADLEQALAGGQIISKSVAMLAEPFVAPAPGNAAGLIVRDLPSAQNMAVFESGDVVRVRAFSRAAGSLSIADCWGVVTGYTDGGGADEGKQGWTFTRSSAPNSGAMATGTVVAVDSIVLDYGVSGNGFYEVNAIDGLYGANSPYWQIVTWSGHPHTGRSVRLRGGNLNGVNIADYGLVLGTDVSAGGTTTFDFRASTGALRLGPVGSGKANWYWNGSQMRLQLNTTPYVTMDTNGLTLLDSVGVAKISLDSAGQSYFSGVMTIGTSGEIRQGTGTVGSSFTGLRIWRDGSIGRIAGYNSNTLQWYAATDGRFYAGGGNVLMSAEGVDLQQDDYITNDTSRSIAWWPDVTNRTGYPTQNITARYDALGYNHLILSTRGASSSGHSIATLSAATNGGSETSLTVHSDGNVISDAPFSVTLSTNTWFLGFGAASGGSNPVQTGALGSYAGKVRVNVNGTEYWMPFYN